MTYTLFYGPGAASMAVHWMLIELGAPLELVRVDLEAGDQRDPAYLQLNPAGRVPTLVVDHRPYTESAALLMLLAERHPKSGLAPPPASPERAKWLETMLFLANTVSPAMRDWFYADTDGKASGAKAVRALARSRIEGAWDRLDAQLGGSEAYLFGDRPGAADFLAAMLLRWSRNMPKPANQWPALAGYVGRMADLPSYHELCEREGIAPWP